MVWEDNNFLVLHIKNYSAAKYYGKNTKWCISGNFAGNENKGEYYFNTYLQNDYSAFYFVINKHTGEKWCICMKKNAPKTIKEIWDVLNEPVENIPGLPTITEIGYEENREEFYFDDTE